MAVVMTFFIFFAFKPRCPELVPGKMVVVVGICDDQGFFWSRTDIVHGIDEVFKFGHVEKSISIHIGVVEHPHEQFFFMSFVGFILLMGFIPLMGFVLLMSFIPLMRFVSIMMADMIAFHCTPEFIP